MRHPPLATVGEATAIAIDKPAAPGAFIPEDFGMGRLFQEIRDAVIVAEDLMVLLRAPR